MKLMYLLWGPRTADALHAPALHRRLAAAGATALQLNVCDADVAAAQLRISTYDEPVAAVAAVWCETDNGPITDALGAVAERVQGWIVEEREPLHTPRPADGTRYDALANIALLRIPDELSREEWLRNWHDRHTTVAIETQATFGYVQNTVVAAVTPGPRVDGLVEELFPMAAITDQHAFWGSGGDTAELRRRAERMMASVATFGADRDLDVIPTSRYRYDLGGS
ncbi:hypothetical protein NONO_c12220 [Nocardia nova SH22a]|uniref:Uncharacterized protein n=1 Tax=Nocardia nova SH22a TaxID=1415166 RepID=W5TA68_9NOCA|nr:EthD domain-containing protein [Nocardia nova]AHH16029.1 hypothetical protein NONO_c12220 [Nocardia nova SH22a]